MHSLFRGGLVYAVLLRLVTASAARCFGWRQPRQCNAALVVGRANATALCDKHNAGLGSDSRLRAACLPAPLPCLGMVVRERVCRHSVCWDAAYQTFAGGAGRATTDDGGLSVYLQAAAAARAGWAASSLRGRRRAQSLRSNGRPASTSLALALSAFFAAALTILLPRGRCLPVGSFAALAAPLLLLFCAHWFIYATAPGTLQCFPRFVPCHTSSGSLESLAVGVLIGRKA